MHSLRALCACILACMSAATSGTGHLPASVANGTMLVNGTLRGLDTTIAQYDYDDDHFPQGDDDHIPQDDDSSSPSPQPNPRECTTEQLYDPELPKKYSCATIWGPVRCNAPFEQCFEQYSFWWRCSEGGDKGDDKGDGDSPLAGGGGDDFLVSASSSISPRLFVVLASVVELSKRLIMLH